MLSQTCRLEERALAAARIRQTVLKADEGGRAKLSTGGPLTTATEMALRAVGTMTCELVMAQVLVRLYHTDLSRYNT